MSIPVASYGLWVEYLEENILMRNLIVFFFLCCSIRAMYFLGFNCNLNQESQLALKLAAALFPSKIGRTPEIISASVV
jgi:hypothetical protein